MMAKLTSRQRRFLKLAASPYGYDPWDPPPYAPILRNEELSPLTEAGLVFYSEINDVWIATPAGHHALSVSEEA